MIAAAAAPVRSSLALAGFKLTHDSGPADHDRRRDESQFDRDDRDSTVTHWQAAGRWAGPRQGPGPGPLGIQARARAHWARRRPGL
jgi:hypothetical protein